MMLSALNEEACHEDEQLRKFRFIRKVTFLLLTSISGTPALMILMTCPDRTNLTSGHLYL